MTATAQSWLNQRWTVNLSILFTELPLVERPAAAKAAGFDAAELWWTLDGPTPPQADLDALRSAFVDAGVQLTGLNFDAGNMAGGDKGLLSRPADSQQFRDNIAVAVGLADSLGCKALNALYGNRVEDVPVAEQDALALENLALAAQAAHGIGAILLVEALNAPEAPQYGLLSSKDAVALVDAVNGTTGLGNTKFLCDLYHLARNGEDLAAVITEYADRIGHVQIADVPGRNFPGSGELDFPGLLGQLDAVDYEGYIGLEYKPVAGVASADSFEWLPRELRRRTR
ncbi:TIM barrel protein [Streptacidiphilus fuscans]|uniref:TIM barrel protein n=1 Tax=Streptacidiphilus fuscans TaxID=2789292 RepID=A0A931B4V0_9ACTN|nr:TIM barrel protein [Streptacidiphilus fuscans]MBF9070241.1 TIM barrel protein [Streptacidiphilus fuscans]